MIKMRKQKGHSKRRKLRKKARQGPPTSKAVNRKHAQVLRQMARKVRKSASQKCIREELLGDPEVHCAHCGSKKHLEIHHCEHLNHMIRRLNITNDQRLEDNYDTIFDIENMCVLCHKCHLAIHREPGVNR